ncbi:hypothetical protein GHK61_20960 [Sinorhizobium meliloti]|nr:hypothetical protein CDO25_22890 [Sinorhizobium meliloti]MQX58825.1 hypothetical protein [Sinorhizobium meliloti]
MANLRLCRSSWPRSGMTTDEFDRIVRAWTSGAKHPNTGQLYMKMVSQPRLELLAYHQSQRFQDVHCVRWGIDSMRVFSEECIPPAQVIGSSERPTSKCATERPC